jgi:hypothetical protein
MLNWENLSTWGYNPPTHRKVTRIEYKVSYQKDWVDSVRIRLNYYSVPLILKVTSTNQRFYALTGVEAAYRGNSFLKAGNEKEDLKTSVSEFNLALHFGAGFRIPLKFGRIFIELRYAQGLINLSDEPVEESYIPCVKTGGFKLLTGYEIPLSRSK